MAGGPPEMFRKYMKAGSDGRWYWDDGNSPDAIVQGVKGPDADGGAGMQAGLAGIGYGISDGLMAASGAQKVEHYKAPETKGTEKAKSPFQPAHVAVTPVPAQAGPVSPTASASATAKPVSQDEQLYTDMMGTSTSAPAGGFPSGGVYVQGPDGKIYLAAQPDVHETSYSVPATNGKIATGKDGKSVNKFDGNTSTMGYEMKPMSAAMVTPEEAAKQDAQKTPGNVFMGKDGVRYVVGDDGSMQPVGKFAYGVTKPGPQPTFGPEAKATPHMPANGVDTEGAKDFSGKTWDTWTPPGSAANGVYASSSAGSPVSYTGPKAINPLAGRYVATEDLRKAPDEFQQPSPVKRAWAATPDEQLYQDMMSVPLTPPWMANKPSPAPAPIKAAPAAPPVVGGGDEPGYGMYTDPKTRNGIAVGTKVKYPPVSMGPENNPWYAEGGPKEMAAPKPAQTHPWGGASPKPYQYTPSDTDIVDAWAAPASPSAPKYSSFKVVPAPVVEPPPPITAGSPIKSPKVKVSPMPKPEVDPVLQDEIDGSGIKAQAKSLEKGDKELTKLNAKKQKVKAAS